LLQLFAIMQAVGAKRMELHQIRYFLAVAETLNFTRAAEQSNVTQPALTKAVQKLEYELGGPLLLRERNLTQLTDLGKQVLPLLQRTFASAQAVHARATEFKRKDVAPLKVGLAPTVSASLLISPLGEISQHVPGLEVELVEAAPEELASMLLNGDLNVAMVGGNNPAGVRIDQWQLFTERYVVLVPNGHHLTQKSQVGVEDFVDAAILERVGHDGDEDFRRFIFSEAEPAFRHRSRHDGHLQQLAAAGFGVLLAPEHMPHLDQLRAVPFSGDAPMHAIHMLVVQGRQYSPALDAFIKVARVKDWSAGHGVHSPADRAPAPVV
jgi:DNA-binding transcriptional LysR family regulator